MWGNISNFFLQSFFVEKMNVVVGNVRTQFDDTTMDVV